MSIQFTDMDMLQDYEKDARLAASGYMTAATEISDQKLRSLFLKAANASADSHLRFASLIEKRGDHP